MKSNEVDFILTGRDKTEIFYTNLWPEIIEAKYVDSIGESFKNYEKINNNTRQI